MKSKNLVYLIYLGLLMTIFQSYPINKISERFDIDKFIVSNCYFGLVVIILLIGLVSHVKQTNLENKKRFRHVGFLVLLMISTTASHFIYNYTRTKDKTIFVVSEKKVEFYYFEKEFYENNWKLIDSSSDELKKGSTVKIEY